MEEGIPPLPYFECSPPLPHDPLMEIFRRLDCSELLNASAVSVGWRSAAVNSELWRELGRRRFGDQLAAPSIEKGPTRVAGLDGTYHTLDWRLRLVQRQFEQLMSPSQLAERRTFFLDEDGQTAPADHGLWWMRRFHAFAAALGDDPWGGAAVHAVQLKCAAAEASSVAHGRQHVCSSPLQELADHARHVIPHRRWAACARCARVVCDDCVNGVHGIPGRAMTRCDGCLRLFCGACDYHGLVRFCCTCENSFCMSCVAVRQCEPCGVSTCSRCVGIEIRTCCSESPGLPALCASRPTPTHTPSFGSNRLGVGVGLDDGCSSHQRHGAVSGSALLHSEQEIQYGGNDGGRSGRIVGGIDPELIAATATATAAEQLWWIHADANEGQVAHETMNSVAEDSVPDAHGLDVHDGSGGGSSSDEDFGDHLLQLASFGVDQRIPLESSDDCTGSSDSGDETVAITVDARAAGFEEFHAQELLDELSSDEEEGAEALRLAELHAFVSMLTTPEEEFSDKVASQFDAMFEGLGDGQAGTDGPIGEGDDAVATVRAMGDFDSGYDAHAQAAARQAM